MGSREVIAFVLDGSSEPCAWLPSRPRTTIDGQLVRLAGEATAEDPGGEIAGLLAHPAMKEISEFLHEVAAGRTLLVVPHGLLHGLPIHLQPERGGQIEPRSGTHYLPTASLLRVRRAPAYDGGHVMVAGDPLGDLDFAHVECADVGRRFDVEPTMGAQVTLDWIASQLSDAGQARLVHLACHAVFDARRPERSGLELAPLNGSGRRATEVPTPTPPASAAGRPTSRRCLSCSRSTGTVRWWSSAHAAAAAIAWARETSSPDCHERSSLSAGARVHAAALVMSLWWEVDDMATAVLMSDFYDAWERHGGKPEHAGLALSEAQCRMRDMTAADLVRFGGRGRGRRGRDGQRPPPARGLPAISGAHQVAGL